MMKTQSPTKEAVREARVRKGWVTEVWAVKMKLDRKSKGRHILKQPKPEAPRTPEGFLTMAFKEEQENPREGWGQGASKQVPVWKHPHG